MIQDRMPRVPALVALVLSVTALLACAEAEPPAGSYEKPPNIIYIMMDDLHYDDLGSYGSDFIETPYIDRVTHEGLSFTQYYVNGPVCSPTRVALLTGQYPHKFNMKFVVRLVGYPGPHWRSGPSGRGIPGYVTTVAEVLNDHGYKTAQMGKWHAGKRQPEFRPIHQGFDHSVISLASSKSIHQNVVMLIDDKTRERTTGHLTDVVTDYALRFIRSAAEEPFFLNLWYISPHVPLEPSQHWAAQYEDSDRGRYAAMVSHVDEQVGRILEALESLGLRQNTLIFITSDNGGEASTHPTSRFRGFKSSLYEGGIRVPMIASWPGVVPEAALSDEVVVSFDLLPTIADLLRIDPTSMAVDGKSFKDVLLGGESDAANRTLFWEYIGRGTSTDNFAVRRGDWKLVSDRGQDFLFDISQDPREERNQALQRPEVTAELSQAYQDWRMTDRQLAYRIESTSGEVELAAPGELDARFGRAGGTIHLVGDPLFDFHDGDFSFSLWVRTSPEESHTSRMIAYKKDSWSLYLDQDRIPRLAAEGEEGDDDRTELVGQISLTPGEWHLLSFTVRGSITKNSKIRLYLDDVLQDDDETLLAIRPDRERIILGATDGGSHGPFVGELQGLRIYLMPLRADEVRQLFESKPSPAQKEKSL